MVKAGGLMKLLNKKEKHTKKEESPFSAYVTIDPYDRHYYIYRNAHFSPLHKLTYNKNNFLTSLVASKDIIQSTVYISRSIPDEDISDVLELKAYEELGLDQAKEYKIGYIESKVTTQSEREFHVFIADPERLYEIFSPVVKDTKYIDLVIPSPILMKKLYDREILSDTGVDGFIYFTMQDAFIAIYRYGEFLYSKTLDYSLEQIYEKYCEIRGEKVDEKEFFSTLQNEGLKAVDSVFREAVSKIFSDLFLAVNDVIIYVKRAYEIETLDHLYIGSSLDPIIGLNEYSQSYLGLRSSEFNFDYHTETDEWYIDQLHYLMLLYAIDGDYEESVNLTLFERPPPFIYRPSGQFIITMILTASLVLAYPVFYLVGSYMNKTQIYLLGSKERELAAEVARYKKIIAQKQKKIDQLDKKIAAIGKKYEAKTKTLISIYDKKVNYLLKSGIYHNLVGELNKYGVKTDKIVTRDNLVYVSLISEDEGDITELVKGLTQKFGDSIKQIDIDKISRNEDGEFYTAILKVELK